MKYSKQFVLSVLFSLAIWTNSHAVTDVSTLTADINTLITQGNQLVVDMNAITITAMNMGTELSGLDSSVSAYTDQVLSVYASLDGSSGMLLTDELMVSMQTLSSTASSMSNALLALSNQVTVTAPLTFITTLDSSLSAMLRLSDDIGSMANRIGEMADRILIMSDNIGLMADRILATQIIQGDNVGLSIDAILQSQKNTLALIAMFNL